MALENGRNIQDLYQQLQSRGVRLTHQFQLQFNIIDADLDGVVNANDLVGQNSILKNVTIWAEGVNLPGRTQNYAPFSYLGYPLQVPTNMDMTQTLDVVIRCDRAMEVQRALLKWQSALSRPVEGTEIDNMGGDKTLRASTADIILIDDKKENIELVYVLQGLMPSNIGEISFSNEAPGIATFPASFAYQYWYINEDNVENASPDTRQFGNI